MSGLDAAAAILARAPQTKVLMLTTFDEDEVVDAALRLGVVGFLLKSSPPEDLVDAIRAVGRGDGYVHSSVAATVIEDSLRRRGGELESTRIGVAVLERLRDLDEVAYLRFASVYKDFTGVDDFADEVRLLLKDTGAPASAELP